MGCWAEASPWEGGEGGALAGGVEGAPLVPLHVPDAAHGLHLGLGGPEVTAVLVIALLQQVLQPAVARVLVADPPAGPEVGGGHVGKQETQMERETRGMAQQLGRVGLPIIPHYLGVEQSTTTLPGSSLCFLPPLDAELTTSRSNCFFKIFFKWTIFLKSLLNLLYYCFCFMFLFFGPEAYGILAP